MLARRAYASVRYVTPTTIAPRRRTQPNPGSVAYMAKRKAQAAPKAERRPRGEIDRNYFFGDVFIKTGVALYAALALIAAATPGMLRGTLSDGAQEYATVMGVFAAIGLVMYLVGRHLRREATQWDYD
jgi:hypothetical protein